MSEGPDNLEAVRRCTALLEAVVKDRSLLMGLSAEDRRRFLMAAGRASRPERDEVNRLARATRRHKRQERYQADCKARAATGIRTAREAPVFTVPAQNTGVTAGPTPKIRLERPRHCYVCKTDYQELHPFYDSMCQACGDFNYAKRFQTVPLTGRVAIITGARVKIGYHAALMMLRAGARVIVTTRFPHDAAQRFTREPDFELFGERLQVHGLDLRHAPSVELFASYMCSTLDRLDFLINNAAQTVRRPPGFYSHLLAQEARALGELPAGEQHLLRSHAACTSALTTHRAMAPMGLSSSAKLSQIPYNLDDANLGGEIFPVGKLDADRQQIDLRRANSWRLTLGEVPTPEVIEVQLVNAVAPFILCAKLKPLMLKEPSRDKHIVNVSAIEGQFARHTKTDKHPHTNMAKAALNMMTFTSASDYVRDGIHMNAVDTGWVTDEDPAEITHRKQAEIDFHPPLDIVDGAARICDPFMNGLLTGEHLWGKFLKDYRPAKW